MSSRTVVRGGVTLAFALGLATVTPAAAQNAPQGAMQRAQALFMQGRAAIDAGDCERAVTLLRESQALYAAGGTLLNLARCEAELGQVASAWQHLQELLTILAPDDPRRPLALEQAATLEPRVPRLRIEVVAGSPAPVRIAVDGVELAPEKLREDLWLDPGERVVEVEWPGGKRERRSVTLTEGKRTVTRLGAAPPGAALASRPRGAGQLVDEADAAPRSIVPAVAVGSLALVGVGVGVGFTVKANNASNMASRLLQDAAGRTPRGQHVCPSGSPATCASLSSVLAQQDRNTTIAAVSYGVAGLAAASAVGLLIWARPWANRERNAAVAPVVLVGGGGVRAEGTF